MPDLSDPLVREAIREARTAARSVRDRLEELIEAADNSLALLDRLDDLAAEHRLRVVG